VVVRFSAKSIKACLFRHAFFICCVFSLPASSAFAADACRLQGDAQWVTVKKVLDGDTVVLTDGRSVRLVGINTPEIAHKGSKGRKGNPAEPLSVQAQQALQQLVTRPVQLQLGLLAADHYGRTLARLFSATGESLEVQLLQQGLGFAVIKAPDFRYHDCVIDAANTARARNLGVWREPYYRPRDAQSIGKSDTGFRRVRGVVSSVEVRRKQLWIELRGNVVIKVAAKNVGRFNLRQMAALTGQSIEVSGWLTSRSGKRAPKKGAFKPYLIQIDDPALLIAAPH
jgi:endonuclease YncB( thermonuclease family)